MSKLLRKFIIVTSLLGVLFAPLSLFGQLVYADTLINGAQGQACNGVGLGANGCGSDAGNSAKINTLLKNVIDLLSIIIGIAAVLIIIIQGFRFIVSGGDPSAISNARNAILYAVIGLIIAALAQLIVHYVIAKGR